MNDVEFVEKTRRVAVSKRAPANARELYHMTVFVS